MAKKKREPGRILSFLRNMVGEPPVPITTSFLGTNTEQSISGSERDKILERIINATRGPVQSRGNSYIKYIKPLARQIAATRLDAKAIEALAPEVKTAKEIVIPSIISPTDMRDGNITIKSNSPLITKDENDKISALLDTHFNTTLKLSTKLPDWIHEGLYGAGAKPVMVLPITEIDTIISDPTAILSKTKLYDGTEALLTNTTTVLHNIIDRIETTSILGLADPKIKSMSSMDMGAIETLRPAIESAVKSYVNDIAQFKDTPSNETRDSSRSYDHSKAWSATVIKEVKTFSTSVLEGLTIVDNPDLLKIDRAKKKTSAVAMTAQMANVYKTQTLITINPETKASVDHPIVMELPPESVVPIFTPGTPTDHIGYFVLLDEFGNPLRVTDDGPLIDLNDNRQATPSALYKSFGFDDNHSIKGGRAMNEQTILMSNVYQTIVEAHLKARLKSGGLENIYIGASSSVYRCMFARYLSLRKTRMLFVPRDLMTYMCFRYNEDGTGRSKIEDIKFILSLKITMLICRVMSAMNAAINRKKININFVESMGDPIAFMQMVEKEVLDKAMTNFTYDPVEITRTIAQKAITVVPKGIPGIENFEISTEPNTAGDMKPDEGLLDDLNNMMILQLDVPPSAYNLLGEHEFSRSIATNNLFFSRRISAYQKIVCEHTGRHVQIYTHMSQPLKDSIRSILSAGDDKKSTTSSPQLEAGTTEEKTVSLEDKLSDVIKHIEASLPAANIAPNKTEFEELDAVIASISTALDAVFDNDMGSNDDNPIAFIRTLVKSDIVRNYMSKIGAARDVLIPDLADPEFMSRIGQTKLNLTNIVKMLKQTVSVTQADDTNTTGGQTF